MPDAQDLADLALDIAREAGELARRRRTEGVAIAATLLTLGDTVCLGFNVDAEAVPDLDVLEECLQRSLDEVLAAG